MSKCGDLEKGFPHKKFIDFIDHHAPINIINVVCAFTCFARWLWFFPSFDRVPSGNPVDGPRPD